MTVETIRTNSPTVGDAGLPTIAYEHAQNPKMRTGSFGKPVFRGRLRSARTGPKC